MSLTAMRGNDIAFLTSRKYYLLHFTFHTGKTATVSLRQDKGQDLLRSLNHLILLLNEDITCLNHLSRKNYCFAKSRKTRSSLDLTA